MTPLERAARALCENPSEDPDEMIIMINGETRPRWRAEVWRVEAVLNAMREPSDAMERHAEYLNELNDGVARAAWQAMIDAALTKGLTA